MADLEVARVWRRVWQMACRHEQIPAVGDRVVYESPGVSLVVVRSGPDEVRAFHNSCLHRGTQLRAQPGRIEELRCPFHGFTWNLDGSFAGVPCPWDFPTSTRPRSASPRQRTGTWGGFVFVTVDPLAPSLEDYLEILPAHFAVVDLSDRYLSAHVVRVVPCNWKVALEAFIESYHTVAVHPQLLTTSGDAQTQYDVYEGVRHVNRMITPVGIASDHVERAVGEQDILDAMFLTKDDADAVVPAGVQRPAGAGRAHPPAAGRAHRGRLQPGHRLRGPRRHRVLRVPQLRALGRVHDAARLPVPAPGTRPPGDGHGRHVARAGASSGPRPAPAPTRHLAPGERWADAPELGYLGRILDQDTATLARVQHGLESAGVPDVTLARYQESRIRHFHATLTEYLQD